MKTSLSLFSLLVGTLITSHSAQATLLVYEGFDYGLTEGTTMNSVATNATGLTGSYGLGANAATTASSSVYNETGLYFGSNFSVAGGAMTLSVTPTGSTGSAQLRAALNTGTITGTAWQSYLFSYGTTGSIGGTAQTRINGAQTTSLNARLTVLADNGNATTGTLSNGIQYGTETVVAGTNNIFTLGTTYLALARFTNIGATSGTGTGEMWAFTTAGYEDWLNLGGSLEENLTTYALTGSHITTTTTLTETNTATFSNSQFLSFAVSSANTTVKTQTFDEVRWGSDLSDVTPVPEPSVTVLLLGAGVAVTLTRFKRKSAKV